MRYRDTYRGGLTLHRARNIRDIVPWRNCTWHRHTTGQLVATSKVSHQTSHYVRWIWRSLEVKPIGVPRRRIGLPVPVDSVASVRHEVSCRMQRHVESCEIAGHIEGQESTAYAVIRQKISPKLAPCISKILELLDTIAKISGGLLHS